MTSIPQMPDRKIAGIYGIIHTSTSRIYVGSAISIADRWRAHLNKLKNKAHENTHIQRAWDKYGFDAFEWVILEVIDDTSQLIATEQKWMNRYQACDPSKGFNINPIAGSNLGRKVSEITKERMRLSWKTRVPRIHYGGVLNEQAVKQILARLATDESVNDIARDFNVSQNMIRDIAKRKSYAKVEITPDIEQGLLRRSNRHTRKPRTGKPSDIYEKYDQALITNLFDMTVEQFHAALTKDLDTEALQ